MHQLLFLSSGFVFLCVTVLLAVFSLVNVRNRHMRAAVLSAVVSVVSAAVFLLFYRSFLFNCIVSGLTAAAALTVILFRYPERENGYSIDNSKRFDERDISFSRFRLKNETENYRDYYSRHPEREEVDSRTRALPGLLAEGSRYFHRLNSAASDAAFFLLEHLKSAADGPVAQTRQYEGTERIQKYLKSLSKLYGVSCYGTAEIKPARFYSHAGRSAGNYGSEIPAEHRYAIVIGSEMKPELTATAPFSPEVIETGLRYVDCAVWAVQTASIIRSMGYSARAHTDGNYQVVAPLVALDAGLGGFGWSSVFLTKKFGPRLRFSVVTTDMKLSLPEKKQTEDFLSFCNVCRKCAASCPSGAISPDKLEKLNADRCFMYWNAVGTDCGKCLAVCPMGHPWGFLKTLALKSRPAGTFLKVLDDVFYGKKPKTHPVLKWMGSEE